MSRRRDTAVRFRKLFRAVPLTRVRNRPRTGRKGRGFAALLVALPLATFTEVSCSACRARPRSP
ncbi:MAG: hypothetical protein ACXU60_12290, partial [Croceibacterium sp.]